MAVIPHCYGGVLELRTNQGLLFAEHPTPSSKVSESLRGVV